MPKTRRQKQSVVPYSASNHFFSSSGQKHSLAVPWIPRNSRTAKRPCGWTYTTRPFSALVSLPTLALVKKAGLIQSAFCWAHARRDYADALKALKDGDKSYAHETVAHKALVQIAAIYKADEALKDITPEERYSRRQKEVKPLVEAYFAWVKEQEPETIVSGKTRDGLNYSMNQEKYLKVFLEDGNVPIDNSATERAIRPFTIGRANWHIIDSVHGAQASAVIYSLVETAKANKLKIYAYLKHLLTEIPKHMDDTNLDFLEDLLPWSENLPEECRKNI